MQYEPVMITNGVVMSTTRGGSDEAYDGVNCSLKSVGRSKSQVDPHYKNVSAFEILAHNNSRSLSR